MSKILRLLKAAEQQRIQQVPDEATQEPAQEAVVQSPSLDADATKKEEVSKTPPVEQESARRYTAIIKKRSGTESNTGPATTDIRRASNTSNAQTSRASMTLVIGLIAGILLVINTGLIGHLLYTTKGYRSEIAGIQKQLQKIEDSTQSSVGSFRELSSDIAHMSTQLATIKQSAEKQTSRIEALERRFEIRRATLNQLVEAKDVLSAKTNQLASEINVLKARSQNDATGNE